MADLTPRPSLVLAAGAAWPPICLSVVTLRFWARWQSHGVFGTDDWLCIPALILTWGLGAIIVAGVNVKALAYPTPPPGPGETPLTASSYELRTTRLMLWIFCLLQIPHLATVKLSFIYFYRRIFCHRTGRSGFNLATKVCVGLLIAWAVAFWFSYLFICGTDFGAYWHSQATVMQRCGQNLKWQNGFAVSDVIFDFLIILLPVHQIWKLELSGTRKWAVAAIFSLGVVAIAASLARLAIYTKSIRLDFQEHTDNDLLITGALYWSMVESGLALLAACLPVIYGYVNTDRQGAPGPNDSLPIYEIYGNSRPSSRRGSSRGAWRHSAFVRQQIAPVGSDSEDSDRPLRVDTRAAAAAKYDSNGKLVLTRSAEQSPVSPQVLAMKSLDDLAFRH